jgi:hypothetical protein
LKPERTKPQGHDVQIAQKLQSSNALHRDIFYCCQREPRD